MSTMESGHAIYKPYEALHKPGCLVRHEGYKKNDTCSHRWQAKLKADSDSRYNSAQAKLADAGWKRKTVKRWLGAGKGAFDRVLRVFALDAFGTCWWPWPNQAHHMLPNSVLRTTVVDFSATTLHMDELIFKGLLSEHYNINDKLNMIPLPTDDRDARVIGLPTHPSKHNTYSAEVRKLTNQAVKVTYEPLKSQMASLEKEHRLPEAAKLRDRLEDISKHLYEKIWAYGATLKGGTGSTLVDHMPASLFKM
jgi:hypothetical protein